MNRKSKRIVLAVVTACIITMFPLEGMCQDFFSQPIEYNFNLNWPFSIYGVQFDSLLFAGRQQNIGMLSGLDFDFNIILGPSPGIGIGVGATIGKLQNYGSPGASEIIGSDTVGDYYLYNGLNNSLKIFLRSDFAYEMVDLSFDVGASYNMTEIDYYCIIRSYKQYYDEIHSEFLYESITPFTNVRVLLKIPDINANINFSVGWKTLILHAQLCNFITYSAGFGIRL